MIARWMIVGFVLWLVVTLAFRFVGEDFFTTGPSGNISWLFMTLPFIMFALTFLLLKLFKVDPSDRAEAASIFAVPGLLIGIYEINSFPFVFPNLDPALGPSFSALMFACYAAVIIAGIVSSRLHTLGGSSS
jgi:cytochrome bd-type quinol oxidase subunit 2